MAGRWRVRPKKLLCAFDRQSFDLVDELATAVVPLSRVSLGVLVRQDAANRFQHRRADEVLRGDQLDAVTLAAFFAGDRPGNLGIALDLRAVDRSSIGGSFLA